MGLRQAVLIGLLIGILLISAMGAELSRGAEEQGSRGAGEHGSEGARESAPQLRTHTGPEAADWTRLARIATPYDYPDDESTGWEDAVDRTVADGVNVILDWAAFSDTYPGRVLDPAPGLADLQQRVEYVHTHHPGVRFIVYIAPFEMQTPNTDMDMNGEPDPGVHTAWTDHPDWLQMGLDGRRAVFYGSQPGMPFWVDPTDEDVWLCPNNAEYRAHIMSLAADIAATGVDGVWFDVPFFVHDFGEGWQAQWPCHCPVCRAKFQAETGYTLPAPPSTPDWDDPAWLAFVAWRYAQTNDFIADFDAALKAVNPHVQLIIETSVGPAVTATQHGNSPLDLPAVSDLTAHEYGGPYTATKYYGWLAMLADLAFWRHTDGGQPAWLLSYVLADQSHTLDVARLHAGSVLAAGFNYYTSGDYGMVSTPDPAFRGQLFGWLADHDEAYYDADLRPYANVALLFSRQSLDYLDRGNWESEHAYHDEWRGMAMMLLESHIPYRVITEAELTAEALAEYDALVLPLFGAMSAEQAQSICDYVAGGGVIVSTGETSRFDAQGQPLANFQLADVFGVSYSQAAEGTVYVHDYGAGRSVFTLDRYPSEYFWAAAPTWSGGNPAQAEAIRQAFLGQVWTPAAITPLLTTDAPRRVILLPFVSGDELVVRAVNLVGVNTGDAVPTPQDDLSLTLTLPPNRSATAGEVLDFLGDTQPLSFTTPDESHVQATFDLDISAVLSLATTPGTHTTTYYVSPDGDDDNPGTEARPWRTIQKATETLVAGDTVYIRAGTYHERVIPQNSGSAGQYITCAAYPGETAIIDGTGVVVPEYGGLFDLTGRAYIRVSGLRVIHSSYYGIVADHSSHITIEYNYTYDTYSSGISSWGSNHIIVDGNEVVGACTGPWQEHISISNTDTFEVRYNHIHDVMPGTYGKEGLSVKDASSHGKVYGNHVYNLNHVGIYVDAEAEHLFDVEVYQNLVHDIEAMGFALASEQGGLLENVRLYNNIAYNNLVGLWLSACCMATHPFQDITIINNTFAYNGRNGWGGGIGIENTQVQNVVIRNNICSQNTYSQMAADPSVLPELTADHNLTDGDRDPEFEFYGVGDLVDVSPSFVNPGGGDFHLQGSSPAIDQGSPADAPGDDFDGHARPYGAGVDIGADEFTLYGDLDYDCDVDIADIMLVAACWRSTDPACAPYDLDADGDIDIVDVMLVAVHWGETCETGVDKWALWTGGTQLRGANIWQRRVYPELDGTEFLGPGPVGPPYTQQDFDDLAALGANYVNVSHPGLFTETPPFVLDQDIQDNLDNLLAMIEQAGMFAVISARTGPGRSDFTFYWDGAGDWFDESYLNDSMWQDQAAQNAWVAMWAYTAQRYKDNPIVVGYDLMVEPNSNEVGSHALYDRLDIWDPEEFYDTYGGTLYDWNQLYPRITAAIRQVDADTPILIGGNGYSSLDWLPYVELTGDPRTVYTVHQYEPHKYTHQDAGVQDCTYPGACDVDWDDQPEPFDRAWLEGRLSIIDTYKTTHGVPVAVNEFGAVRWTPNADLFMDDEMDLFEQRGMNHALWVWDPAWEPWTQQVDAFNFRHGPDPNNHTDVESGELMDVIVEHWGRNTIGP